SILAIKDPTLEDAGGGGSDAAIDATPIDGAIDAAIDAAVDAAIDGPPAVCTTGACCSPNGQFEPTTKVCNTTTEFQCSGNGTTNCAAQPQQRTVQTFCKGDSAMCDGQVMNGNFSNIGASCTADQLCQLNGTAAPTCTPCNGFGCNPTANACRPAKVFLLLSVGGFQGGFFGNRAGFDARCAADFADPRFPDRGCNPSHAHAMVTINSADSIALMASRFGIPTAPVHRVDDDAFVTGSWNNVIDSTQTLTAAPSSLAPGSANALVWTGFNNSDTCTAWTSSASAVSGNRGDTASATALRLSHSNLGCNLTAHLLCVCWSGP
ncbi:MAG TPA: hypothetical protein VFD36_06715, partial [Kofleriaceae bacterium]|nr:hypothetical protein [Kofleriaceae bacterium]